MGSAAAGREDKKVEEYSNLSDNYNFVPIGVKTYGAYCSQGIKVTKRKFNQTDWQKIQEATGEKLSTFYLLQSI